LQSWTVEFFKTPTVNDDGGVFLPDASLWSCKPTHRKAVQQAPRAGAGEAL